MPAGAHHHGAGSAEPYTVVLERMNRFQEPEAKAVLAALQLPVASYGLDVGCGVGLYALWLAELIGPQGRVLGIEPSAERAAAAQQCVGAVLAPGQLEFRQGNAMALDMPDATFDWIWCGDVLHHVDEPVQALKEFHRVLRPGGQVIIKESQVCNALFLPGYPELERQLQRAEMEFSRQESGPQSFQERRQRTVESMHHAGFTSVTLHTTMIQRQAPLDSTTRAYIQHTIFERNWGPRLRDLLSTEDWQQRCMLCEADSPQAILARDDYFCLCPICMFSARLPAA